MPRVRETAQGSTCPRGSSPFLGGDPQYTLEVAAVVKHVEGALLQHRLTSTQDRCDEHPSLQTATCVLPQMSAACGS